MLFETTKGNKVELKDFMTGGEFLQLQELFLGGMKMSASGEAPQMDASVTLVAQKKAIELLVLSLNDSNENILQRILDLPKDEYLEIQSKVDSITNPEAKKND